MKIIQDSIQYPVTTAVGVILLALFGGLALYQIPIQLIPTVDKPQIRVRTQWPGALPLEVERQIIQEQEDQLKALEGLESIESTSSAGLGEILVTFKIGTDPDTALLDVSNRLGQVPRYPDGALKPEVRAASSDTQFIAIFVMMHIDREAAEGPIAQELDFIEDVVAPEFERVPGVAALNLFGGQRHEMQFWADPVKLAARKMTISQLANALDRENANVSGGDFDEGKGNYTVRTSAEYASAGDVESVVVAYQNDVPIFARDLGHARLGFDKKRIQAYLDGQPVFPFFISKAPNENLMQIMVGIKEAAARLNRQVLEPRNLKIVQMFDATVYIDSSISLLRQSLYIGAGLAVVVLFLFLRSFTGTLIIALAMPISVIGTFLVMSLTGRTLNVISLAGLAFSIGMVVDNSIVALENIYRHRQMGKSRVDAAFDGAREVWGAILASTLTTAAVFLPVIFIAEEAGQLFRDIAIAISAAVILSMIVAITVIPAMAAKVMGGGKSANAEAKTPRKALGSFGSLSSRIADLVYWICGGTIRRLTVAVVFTLAAILGAARLIPAVEYLPAGNINFVLGQVVLPSNYSLAEAESLRHTYFETLQPFYDCDASGENCPGGGISQAFMIARGSSLFAGGQAKDPLRVAELVPVFRSTISKIPAALGGFRPRNLFQSGRDAGYINLDIVGPDFDRLQEIGGIVLARLQQELPEAQAQPLGGVDRGKPELRIVPNRLRSAELGVSGRELGLAINALVDGAKVSDYQWQGKRIDLKLIVEGDRRHRTHDLAQMPIAVPGGRLVTLDALAKVELTTSPVEIGHRERQRASTIRLTPPQGVPLQTTMEQIEAKIIRPLSEEGVLSGPYRIVPRGEADKLSQTWDALAWNLLLALVITYLLMAALFQSFAYPLVILFSVPLAGFGGLLGLSVMNRFTYQALDILTVLGFFILVGTVVNNAILLVHQSLNHIRNDNMDPREAIRESTRNRIRPIFMSVLTSVFAMLPLVIFPGAGAELYRGIGSVVIGGLLISTVFTLLLVPALFSLVLDLKSGMVMLLRRIFGHGEAQPVQGD